MKHLILFFFLLSIADQSAAAEVALRKGMYEIHVNLELPSILDTGTQKIERVCLSPHKSPTFGLAVLEHNKKAT